MSYENKIGIIADRIIFDCKSANVDLKLVIEEINRISNSEEDIVDTLKNDEELDSQESFDWIEMPIEEEIEQQGFEELADMNKYRECTNCVWDEELGDYVLCDDDDLAAQDYDSVLNEDDWIDEDIIKEDSPNNSLNGSSDIPLMDNLDDISASILSDIYGGTY